MCSGEKAQVSSSFNFFVVSFLFDFEMSAAKHLKEHKKVHLNVLHFAPLSNFPSLTHASLNSDRIEAETDWLEALDY